MPVQPDWRQHHETAWNEFNESCKSGDRIGSSYYIFSKLVAPWTEKADSWLDFQTWTEELEGEWCFRGQREADWALVSSIDRYGQTVLLLKQREYEDRLLSHFQQRAHHIPHLPAPEDKASWFALMQHYGVPTRLLDWTLSSNVALFFAMEKESQEANNTEAEKGAGYAAVWAINREWLNEKMPEDLKKYTKSERAAYFNRLIDWPVTGAIVEVAPHQVNKRMSSQRGILLMKLVTEHPRFDEILARMLEKSHTEPKGAVIRKLRIRKDSRIEFLDRLKNLDIHRGSLFPDQDDFCQSLKAELEIYIKQVLEQMRLAEEEHFETLPLTLSAKL